MTDATPAAGATVALDRLGGDAWAWEKRLTGTCRGCPSETRIALRVGDVEFPAERDGDAFAATVKLRPGANRVAAVATLPDGSRQASPPVAYTVRLTPRPTARIALTVAGDEVRLDGTASAPSNFDAAPIARFTWSVRPRNPAALTLRGSNAAPPGDQIKGPRATLAAPSVDGAYSLSLRVADAAGREDVATSCFVVEDGKARVPDPVTESATWIAPAVVYGVVPRNFDPPNLGGVTARLDDLRDLGVTALWLSPITRTIPDHFGYEVTDYFDVRPEYGTKEDLRELVRQAHARGIRVLMDFVPNHTSEEHPYFKDTLDNGRASAYYAFYDRDDTGAFTYYFDWIHLPNLNYDNPEVRRFMLEAFSYWVRELDVDGFRIDAIWGIKERRPDWLPVLLRELNRIKPDSLLIAEASARDGFYGATGFDAAYDWTDDLGHWAWGDAFGGAVPVAEAMVAALTADGRGYPPDALVFRFLNNNDTGPRFVTTHGVDCYRVALAMLLTLPGLPCLYTGDEVAAEFEPYAATGPIDWTDRDGLRDHVRKLVALRREQPSLHARQRTPLTVEPAASFFAYLRSGAAADPPIAVVLNFSEAAATATVTLPDEAAALTRSGELTDLWTGERIAVGGDGRLTVSMPGWGIRLLTNGAS